MKKQTVMKIKTQKIKNKMMTGLKKKQKKIVHKEHEEVEFGGRESS